MPTSLFFAAYSRARLLLVLLASMLVAASADAGTPPPANDDCTNAVSIDMVPFSASVPDTSGATSPQSDPVSGCHALREGHSVWYSFTATADGVAVADTFGSNFDTLLAVYTGSCGALSEIGCNDNSCLRCRDFDEHSRISFPVASGTTYLIAVTGRTAFGAAASGAVQFAFDLVTPPSNDECSAAVEISTVPFAETRDTIGATTAGSDPISDCGGVGWASVWYRFTAPASGTVTANTFGSSYDTNIAAYFARTCGDASLDEVSCNYDDANESPQSRLAIPTIPGATYLFVVTSDDNSGGDLAFALTFEAAPTPTPTPTINPTVTATRGPVPTMALAKVIEKCQKALVKGARAFVTKKLKLLGTCADGIQKCIQTVADVAKRGACITAAGAKCTAAIDKIVGEETKLRNTVLDKCETIPTVHISGPSGLGFGALTATCGNLDTPAAVADCVAERSACEADRAFVVGAPRTGELIAFAGVPTDRRAMLACLPDHGGAGEDVDLESGAGKAIAKCGSGIAKANATLVGGEYAALAACAGRLFACAQTKRDDAACATKAAAGCVEDLARIGAAIEPKLGPAVAKSCTSPLFDYDLLRRPAAVNLDALASQCALANAPAPTSLDAYGSCLLELQQCRTTSLLRLTMPRAVALLGTLSPPFTFPTDCPP